MRSVIARSGLCDEAISNRRSPRLLCSLAMTVLLLVYFSIPLYADTVRTKVTILTASNQGSDFNIVNDAFRDELIKLFSYTSYEQIDEFLVALTKSQRQRTELPGGYELILTLLDQEKNRAMVQAVIRKGNRQYVDTVLSILKPGVVFLGGPKTPEGWDLIIVLETGF